MSKPLTIEGAAHNHSITDGLVLEQKYYSFKAGAEWQKEKDRRLAKKLNGLQPWIGDRKMQALFTEVINELINQ